MSDSQYTNAILSSSVDLARGYLPAGTKPNSHGQAIFKPFVNTVGLLNHPLDEVKQLMPYKFLPNVIQTTHQRFPDSV